MELIFILIGVSFILLSIAFKLDDKHQALKFFALFFSLYVVLILGKTALVYNNVCEVERINQTIHLNTTHYNYDLVCYENTEMTQTSQTLFKVTQWFYRLSVIYMFIFIIYMVGEYLQKVNKMRKIGK